MRRHIMGFAVASLGMSNAVALAQTPMPPATPNPPMSLTSSSFADGGIIPDKYTQAAPNAAFVSPALTWDGAPASTVSYTIIVHDTDTLPRNGWPDNLHWEIFNIPGTTHTLPEGVPTAAQLPDGSIQIMNGGGKIGFLGPGARGAIYHHYIFEIYALDTKLTLGPDATRGDIMSAMTGHIIAKSTDTGRFHR